MRFLVAVDGSESSDAAVAHAVELARGLGASLTVVHSVDPAAAVETSMVDEAGEGDGEAVAYAEADDRAVRAAIDEAERRGRRALAEARDRVAAAGVDVGSELLFGNPVDALPRYAAQVEVDGIFVGHRSAAERDGELVGSVARGLVERSPVPVTVVR
jgi:nucleotide-binding universal stress UspA family protein